MGNLPPGVFVLIIALLSASAGALLTWVIGYASGGTKPKVERESPSRAAYPSDTEDLLRVSQTKKDLTVFVQGRPVRHLRHIEDPQVRRATVAAINAVSVFAEGWLPAHDQQLSASTSAGKPLALSEPVPSRRKPGRRQTGMDRPSEDPSSATRGLLEEIDALVQDRLRERADLAEQGIRLTQDLDGSVLIYVGQECYRSPDEIPQEEVRALIREAILAWESQ